MTHKISHLWHKQVTGNGYQCHYFFPVKSTIIVGQLYWKDLKSERHSQGTTPGESTLQIRLRPFAEVCNQEICLVKNDNFVKTRINGLNKHTFATSKQSFYLQLVERFPIRNMAF